MEESGSQVAAPILVHQPLAMEFCNTHPMAKKRGSSNFSEHNHPSNDWNPKSWDWDSARFVAKPIQPGGVMVGSGRRIQTDLSRRMDVENSSRNSEKPGNTVEGHENLRLKLGGGGGGGGGSSSSVSLTEEAQVVSRPNKRVKSGSPGVTNYPMCQVDHCREDLSSAKDYHRRHKVCEAHSKASEVVVGEQMQRFCQQCSRFHLLSEFDEGKRSCRRRLAGHNKRRRKTQPEDTTQPLLAPSGLDNNFNNGLNIVNLLAVLACAQVGNYEDKSGKLSSAPDKDQLVQILRALNSLPLAANLASKLPLVKSTNASIPSQQSSENQKQDKGNASSPSTMDFLSVFSSAPTATSCEAFDVHSQPSSEGSDSEKTKLPCIDQASCADFPGRSTMEFSPGGERSCASNHSSFEDSGCYVHKTSPCLPLKLFTSSLEDESAIKLQSSGQNYLSSESSNPSEGRSPLSSPPIVRDLFPMQPSKERVKCDLMPTDGIAHAKATISNECSTSLQLFGGLLSATENGSIQNSPYRAGYTSSGSDNSRSSLISDTQDRTGRIIFKLFDKDPSHLPGSLRTQMYKWLSNSPSEMESFIRPGCVVLSLYLSMPSFAWEQLEENLHNYVKTLISDIDIDFWGNGRFLVHTHKQIASRKDGSTRLHKSRRTCSTPELISISPMAVVVGRKTSLLLRGRRLTASSTKIHCSLAAADYDLRLVPASSFRDTEYDEISLDHFKIDLEESSVLGRCFIEVENNLRGASFPLIVADNNICQELILLEPEINGSIDVHEGSIINNIQNSDGSKRREEVMHFLDELGWLFQRKFNSSLFESPYYKLSRFQFLLVFSVGRDFCALVKTLLDILLEFNLGAEGLARESLEMLSECCLLNKAVQRRCCRMVDLLLRYSILDPADGSDMFVFLPNVAGPGGITPLHLAACASSSDDIIDALTNDPHEVGLHSWNSVLDENGLSPCAYASMRNNNSYNILIARKLASRKAGEVCISIEAEIEQSNGTVEQAKDAIPNFNQRQKPCSRCALVANYSKRGLVTQGLLQRPYINSILLVAAVCVCVCVFLRGHPDLGRITPFAWESLDYGTI